jgi:PIN domain nuclease of toxin-antitoxin system
MVESMSTKVVTVQEAEGHLLELIALVEQGYVLDELPLHHNDPFDRLLIAQAKAEQAWLVSGGSRFQPYRVDVIW